MARKVVLALALVVPLTILYLLYTGTISLFEALLGAIVAFIVGLLFGDVIVEKPGKLFNPIRWIWGLTYALLYFTVIEAKAHLQTLAIIIDPSRMNPGIVRIPYEVESDYAVTTIANSITNTPGTVVVDIDEDRKAMYVHWIKMEAVEDEEARKRVSTVFEKYARRIFD